MRLHRFKTHTELKVLESKESKESLKESKLYNEEARTMVGDGKKPNKFFVTLGYGYIFDDEAEDAYQIPNTFQKDGETIAMVDTFKEALEIANDYDLDLDEDSDDVLTQVTIEDRLNGTIYEKSVHKDSNGDLYEDVADDSKRLNENVEMVNENRQLTKGLLEKGSITQEEYTQIEQADPTPQKKYMFWMAKQLVAKNATIDQLRNTIEEFELFLRRGRVKDKDINTYKDYNALKTVVDELNERGVKSNKELEDDYEVVEDSPELYIAVPHTHEASRKLGLSKFAYRKREEGGGADSAWCTTFKTDSHFLDYYYNQKITFYYVLVKSEEMKAKLKKKFGKNWEDKTMVAIVVHEDKSIDAYDAMDTKMSDADIKAFRKIINR